MKKHILRIAVAVFIIAVSVPQSGYSARPDKEVRNIILLIGDGMGLAQVTAIMIENGYGPINMEKTSHGGFVKTYSANNRVTDSAASGTAYATGHKTNNSYLGIDPDGNPLETILEKANRRGMATGLVASVGIMHATPGAFYGHSESRGNYEKIAAGLLETDIDVAIGGGRHYFEKRKDGRNLVGELESRGYLMASSLEELDGVSHGRAMAIYPGKMYDIPTVSKGRSQEYLPGATAKALEILTNNSRGKGFFLMVEGSLIDGLCHDGDTPGMLAEVRDFDNAVGVALDYAATHKGTLVIILADHETGGLSIPSGNTDFLLSESGVEFNWGTTGHSGTMVPMFSYGPRADYFSGVLNNDEVGRRMQEVLGLK